MCPQPIELLAPARDLACGIAAIDHGADAVYIGGPGFSARAAAANSLADLEQLVRYAHQFRAKVYIALNTLLNDRELEEAATLCHQLYQLGADALIIQDVGLLECDLPPIALHASTQMDNRTPEKVAFLEQVGFSQVVLARELSLAEIRRIRAATSVVLECFVHGALCVSHSGLCSISQAMTGRSANRGQCAQFCRHAYDLQTLDGRTLVRNRYLLSLKDLDLSAHLEELLDAGVRSLKIEGRLKDVPYVKNVTAAYRLALDALLQKRSDLTPASSGRCRFDFLPDPARSFSRGATEAFLRHRRNPSVAEIRTPKSIGRPVGRVVALSPQACTLDGDEPVHAGDGLCFFTEAGELMGLRVNRVEGRRIFPKDGTTRLPLKRGTLLHRNLDVAFNRQLAQSQGCRTMDLELDLRETAGGLELRCCDRDGVVSCTELHLTKEVAKKAGGLAALADRQLRKSGDTIFLVQGVAVNVADTLYLPLAALNELRRLAFAAHLERRLHTYRREHHPHQVNAVPWPTTDWAVLRNLTNVRAAAFYRRHGAGDPVGEAPPAPFGGQPSAPDQEAVLMTTTYCLRAQLKLCPRTQEQAHGTAEPLVLADRTGELLVTFTCDHCGMRLHRRSAPATPDAEPQPS